MLHSWPSATILGQLEADPAGGYLLLPMAGQAAHQPPGRCTGCLKPAIEVAQHYQRRRVDNTVFVSIDLATGGVTTLPFTMPGFPASGQAAW